VAQIAIIVGATALAFIAAAIAYSRGRERLGEFLAFAGTLIFGNGIWLLARAVHLRGHYPDAALWWAIGALVAGHLVKSRLIGIEAGVVAIVWVVLETALFRLPAYAFAGLGVGLLWLAFRTRSAAVLTVAVASIATWITAFSVFVASNTRLLRGAGIVAGAAAVALLTSLLFARRIWPGSAAAAAVPVRRTRSVAAVLSGATLVGILGAVLAVHAWPLWTGEIVHLRVRPVDSRDLLRPDHVALSYPIEDVIIRIPGDAADAIPPDPAGPPLSLLPPIVDPIGDWWRIDEGQAQTWRDREIYLQLQPLPATAPGVAQEHRPVTVSLQPVPGAVNLAGRIVFFTSFDYSFRLQFGLDAFTTDAATARLIDAAMQRDAPIYAEVAITRSGRARVRALVVDGRRIN
jgi:uncharacterized membrane-anchored protein